MRALRGFISYRRSESFLDDAPTLGEDFLERLIQALEQLGLVEVFLDKPAAKRRGQASKGIRVSHIAAGDHYLNRIHRALTRSALVFPVIGPDWLTLLRERAEDQSDDILLHEIRAAFRLEKQIVPILVDGASMPAPHELPEDIRELAMMDAVAVSSADDAATMATALADPVEELHDEVVLGPIWTCSYIAASAILYYLVAVQPHLVGFLEYGRAWAPMAGIWGGLFMWPVFFLPFAQVAFYRPTTILLEQAFNAESWSERFTFITPLAAALVIFGLAMGIEVSRANVPWTVNFDQSVCGTTEPVAAQPDSPGYCAVLAFGPNSTLEPNPLVEMYGQNQPFWAREASLTNAFFYLTMPVAEVRATDSYWAERARVQTAFELLMSEDNLSLESLTLSRTFWAYVVSFAVLILYASLGIATAIVFAVARIRRALDDSDVTIPREDTFLALSFAFVTLMLWVPFRMVTVYFKTTYLFKRDPEDATPYDGITIGLINYLNDVVFAVVLAGSYLVLMAMMSVRFGRIGLSAVGSLAIFLVAGLAYLVYANARYVSTLVGYWQFYMGVAIPLLLVLFALGHFFNPATVRLRDFRRRIR